MPQPAEALTELIGTARGLRTRSLACGEAEEVLNVVLALVVELAVSNERTDRLERLVADLRGESVDALREIDYEGEAAAERQAATEALIVRALRILLDPRAPAEIATR